MWLWLLIYLICSDALWAANPFELGKVDYFDEASLKKALAQEEQKPLDWREPIVGQDGTATYYTPPPPVLALLENPTAQNARAYIAWQREKSSRIQEAQEILNKVMREKE